MRAGKALFYWLCAATNLALPAVEPAAQVAFALLPPAVQKGIQAQLGSGKLGDIKRDEEHGEVSYVAEITKDGRSRDYTLDEDGALLSVEVSLPETPPAVQKTIQNQIAQGTLESIGRTTDDGGASYDVEWKAKDGAAHSFSVLESGKLQSVQVALPETPPAVQAAILKEAGDGQVQDISKTFDDGAVFYDVSVNRGGQDRDFSVAENGRLESRQVFLPELSPAAQGTVLQSIGNGKIRRIDQVFDKKKGVFPFEVEGLKDGKPFDFSVGPKGAFLGMDE